jgi:hypothetical protein
VADTLSAFKRPRSLRSSGCRAGSECGIYASNPLRLPKISPLPRGAERRREQMTPRPAQ